MHTAQSSFKVSFLLTFEEVFIILTFHIISWQIIVIFMTVNSEQYFSSFIVCEIHYSCERERFLMLSSSDHMINLKLTFCIITNKTKGLSYIWVHQLKIYKLWYNAKIIQCADMKISNVNQPLVKQKLYCSLSCLYIKRCRHEN